MPAKPKAAPSALGMQPAEPAAKDLEARLKQATFPMRDKASLIRALGGPGAEVTVAGGAKFVSDEVADLCFAEVDVLRSPEDVVAALSRSSWTRAVFRALNLAWLPILGPDRLCRLAGHIRVRGVPVKSLAQYLDYPISSTAELVEKLARARQSYRG